MVTIQFFEEIWFRINSNWRATPVDAEHYVYAIAL